MEKYPNNQYKILLFPFHKFIRNGNIYLFNVNKMKTYHIDEHTSVMIDQVLKDENSISSEFAVKLVQMELLDNRLLQQYFRTVLKKDHQIIKKKISVKKHTLPITSISLNITQFCNLNCIYCYGDGGQYKKKGLMDEKTAIQSIEWLLKFSEGEKKIFVTFFGGEPMINFQLITFIVQYANKRAKEYNKNIQYGLTTNATLLDDYNIGLLKKYNIKPLISFDGPPEIQNANRPFKNGDNSYLKVVSNIKNLLKEIPSSSCRATIMPTNTFEEVKREICSLGFTNYSIVNASSSLLGNYVTETVGSFYSENLFKFLENEATEFLVLIKQRKIFDSIYKPILRRLNNLIFKYKQSYGCKAGRSYVGISINGDIFPCHRFVGTNKMKIGTIWDDEINRQDYQYRVVTNLLNCKKCWAKFFCGGGCMYINLANAGSINCPDITFCNELKFSVETAISLFHQLDKSDIAFLNQRMLSQSSKNKFCLQNIFNSETKSDHIN